MKKLIDVSPVKQEILSPLEFLELSKNNAHLIAHTQIVPAKLGSDSFGGIDVKYSRPLYKHLNLQK